MSSMKWTEHQLEAINRRNCNLLVAAAAGSGKTAVLVERIIRKIIEEENPVDIDDLLVVTFTKAAAAEMRERIGDALTKELDKNAKSARLQRQLIYLNKASITTIHSFCLEVIKNNFHCIDLDPNFRIADETETILLKLESLEELFEEQYDKEEPDTHFYNLVQSYGGGRDDRDLRDMVLTLYEFIQSHPWPLLWMQENLEAFNLSEGTDFRETAWGDTIIEGIHIELTGFVDNINKAISIIQKSNGLESYLSCFMEDAENLENLRDMCLESSWDTLYHSFQDLKFGRLARSGKDVDKMAQDQVKDLRDEVKKGIKKISGESIIFTSSEIAEDLRTLYPVLNCLLNLVLEFQNKYNEKKKNRLLLDFSDLEHFCLEILVKRDEDGNLEPTEAAMQLRDKYNEILVDEYQDSNLVQEVILTAISKKDQDNSNLFMVGDVKQSIYRFRQARPELFMEKYRNYADCMKSQNSKDVRVSLYKNFRSREEIVNAVNYVFNQIMSQKIGELDYNQEEALNFGAMYIQEEGKEKEKSNEVELHIIDSEGGYSNIQEELEEDNFTDTVDNEGQEQEEERLDSIQSEARMVGKRIQELIGNPENLAPFMVIDKTTKEYRKSQYKDIVILLRTTRNWSNVFVEELEAMGIPVFADTGSGYFKTMEVQTIMSLLQIIDNPMQDIPLITVMRSPIGGFSPEELADIRISDSKLIFYEAMKKYAAENKHQSGEKTAQFLENLQLWREKAQHLPTDELIWYLYSETGYYSFAGAMPGGDQRQANLRILFERARQYEETSYRGLFNFVNFIDRLKGGGGDMGSAMLLGENDNLVRIMSIHKSKGLEFPIVIVSGCGKRFNLQDMRRSILLHQDLGFGPDYVDSEKRIYYPTAAKQALKSKIKLETLSEEMRILYVAFTRAKEKLIITGSVKGVKKNAIKWAKALDTKELKLPIYHMSRANSFLDWIGTAIIRHPDCLVLRELAGLQDNVNNGTIEDNSCWNIKLWQKSDVLCDREHLIEEITSEDEEIRDKKETLNSSYGDIIRKRLCWEYPFKILSHMPAKVSVTELKRIAGVESSQQDDTDQLLTSTLMKRPAFLEEVKGLSAAERGTVLHFVMQHLDFKQISSTKDIELQITDMVSKEFITQQQGNTINEGKILKFLKSPLGVRLKSSKKLKREIPFNIEINSDKIASCFSNRLISTDFSEDDAEIMQTETVLLQGIIDCYFEEEDKIVLLDYKTDYLSLNNIEEIKERYMIQIYYYQQALERMTGKKVKEKYIYLFSKDMVIEYED